MSAYRGGERCPKCKGNVTTNNGECLACGAVWGPTFLCPHCATHTKTTPDPMLRAVCSACKKPRLRPDLGKDDYDDLIAKQRAYRLWPVTAMTFIPAAACAVGVLAALGTYFYKANAQLAAKEFVAEHGRDVPFPANAIAEALPDPPAAFVLGLSGIGALGIAIFLGVARVRRAWIRREVVRLS